MARYLITGGAGFIGSNLTHQLLARGEKVVVYDDFSTGRRENLEGAPNAKELRLVEGDVRDLKELKKEAKRADFILHHAALPSVQRSLKDPVVVNEVNVLGTLNVLLAAHAYAGNVKRVVYASSSSVYGDSPTLPKIETMPANPLSPYAVSKLAAEEYCRMFHLSYKVDTVCLRYFNVFGPRQDQASQYAAVVPRFITALAKGREPVVNGDGKQSRDFTYVDNVVEANILACQSAKAAGEVMNIACGTRVTILGLASFLAQILEKEVPPKFEDPRPGDVRHSLADVTKAQELLGYRPRYGVEEGLRMTVDWYQSR